LNETDKTKKTENVNCLEGFKCPECGVLEPFYIEVITTVTMFDEGSDNHGDLTWEDDSYCVCSECEYEGKVKDFKTTKDSIW